MSKYERYKPSGMDWFGDIPFHWEQRKFKNISYMKGRIGWQGLKNEEFTFNPDEPFLITGMNFKDGEIDWNDVYHISKERYDEAPEIQLFEGDVLMTKDGTIGKLLFVDRIPYPHKASLNSHLLVFRPHYNAYYPKYLYYQLQTEPFYHHIEITKTGTTFFGITQEAVGIYKLILPPLYEQKIITKYLDDFTQKIDRLISNKKAQVDKLKELRQIEINNAVTKGLNPTVELKDSGVNWLGKIPEHWKYKRLKDLAFVTLGKMLQNEDGGSDELKPYLRSFNVQWEKVDLSDLKEMWLSDYEKTQYRLKENDIVVNEGGEVGRAAIWMNEIDECYIQNSVHKITCGKKLYPNYLLYLFTLLGRSGVFEMIINKVSIGHLTREKLVCVKFLVPPIDEQVEIANYLQQRISAIDKLVKNIESQINKLQELRKITIYEAVIGKIKIDAYAETTA